MGMAANKERVHTGRPLPARGAHVAWTAAYLLYSQVENSTQCPLTMTYAAVPVLIQCHHIERACPVNRD